MLPFSGTANLTEKPEMVPEKYLLQNWKKKQNLGLNREWQSESSHLQPHRLRPITEDIPQDFFIAYHTFSLGF